MGSLLAAALLALLAACGERAPEARAESPADSAPPPAVAAEVDPAVLLAAIGLTPDADGRVVNECGERVTPRIVSAELGGDVGRARLVAIDGGREYATCYGDGPDLHLLRVGPAGVTAIYGARGRMLIVLPTETKGVRDLADGAPGFSFPVWSWDGARYAPAGRTIADGELGDAKFLP